MIVTDIKRQAKRSNRYSIFVDEVYAFPLDELELSGSDLRIGREISDDELSAWKSRSELGKAYNAALRYLSYRLRSEHEVRQYLEKKNHDEDAVEDIIERLTNLNLINDLAFAQAWVADRNRLRPRSQIMLQAELVEKGITREIIAEVLSATDEDEQLDILRRLIEQKASRYANEQKLMAYLASKGYPYGLIKKALTAEDD